MKKITTIKGVFGPYRDVKILIDRYLCDNAELPFSVIGEGVVSDVTTEDFPPVQVEFDRIAARLRIDDAVAEIYSRFTRFAIEYEEREFQAQSYKDLNYSGVVPARVAEFATPSGMSPRNATDLILTQAANLRLAQGALSALRMRKYEVIRSSTDNQARAVASEIIQGIEAIGANIS